MLQKAKNIFNRYNNWYTYSALAVLGVFVLVAGINAYGNSADAEAVEVAPRIVQAAPLQSIDGTASALVYTGTVRAREEAEVRAQKSGVITSVNYRAGGYVPAGAVIATIESNTEAAAIQSARAQVAQAEAALLKVQNGTRTEQLNVLAQQVTNAEAGFSSAQTTARNSILSAHASIDSAFPGGVDTLYTDPESVNPQITLTTTNYSDRIVAQNNRVAIGDYLMRHAGVGVVADSALAAELTTTEQELLFVKTTLDAILQVLAGAVANGTTTQAQIATYTATATSARSGVLSALSAISSARAGLANAQSALAVAKENQNEGVTGARPEDVASAQAAVDAANAGLTSAQVQYANTRITAPISGTLTTLSIKRGSFASQFGLVGSIANTNAREVVVYVPPQTASALSIGTTATVNDVFAGVITEIAAGVDSAARGVAVRIGLTEGNDTLTDGDVAQVRIAQNKTTVAVDGAAQVPVSALKLKEGSPYVLVIENSIAVAAPIAIVAIEGDTIRITHTLSADAVLILDARGIAEGDAVTAALTQ